MTPSTLTAIARQEAHSLSSVIRSRREARGLSLGQLAQATGLSKQHVFSLERGESDNPTVSTLVALGSALGISAHALFRAAITATPEELPCRDASGEIGEGGEPVAFCEACQAPLFGGDDFVGGEDVSGCWDAVTDEPSKKERPCFAYRVGKCHAGLTLREALTQSVALAEQQHEEGRSA